MIKHNRQILYFEGSTITKNVAIASFLLLEKYVDEPLIIFLTPDAAKYVYSRNIVIEENKFICLIPK